MHSGKLILLGALLVLALFFIWRWWSMARAARDPDKVRPPDLVIGRDSADLDLMMYGSGTRIALAGDKALESRALEYGWLIQPALAR